MSSAKERHPEVYRIRDEDPRQRRRTVPMEVLSMGYSRTGTMTMSAAYEILGIPPYHWVTMSENTKDIALWTEALESKFNPNKPNRMALDRKDFDNLLGHAGAITDIPSVIVTEELVAAYPEAKVVLVERDIDKWYDSMVKTVISGPDNVIVPFVERIDKSLVGPSARLLDLITRHYFGVQRKRENWLINDPAYFEEWRQKAKATYVRHNEMVRRVTPPERLLVFKLSDGWGPLCEFLNKPVPECEFPNVNDAEALNEKIALYIAEGVRRGLVDLAVKVAPVAMAVLAVGGWYVWG